MASEVEVEILALASVLDAVETPSSDPAGCKEDSLLVVVSS